MPAAFVKPVDILRVAKVRSANSLRKRIVIVRRCHYVNMIRHKAIAGYFKAVFIRPLLQIIKIDQPVVIDKKYILTIIASLCNMLCNMMSPPSRHCSC